MPDDVEIKSALDLGPPTQEVLDWAKDNIREDPDTRCQKLDDFRDLIYSRGECTPHRTDDAFLLRFLRSRKFSLEAAYKLIVNYYDFKENPGIVEGVRCFELLERTGDADIIIVPPYKDQTGKRILWYRLGKWDPETYPIDDIFAASLLILELAILEESSQITGGICLVDCAGITMQHVMNMSSALAHKIFQIAVTSHPMRLDALHVVNNSWVTEMFFTFFKPFLHSKMIERMYFHGSDMESLHKHIDPKCLPQIYGGMQPHYGYREWVEGFRNSKAINKELDSLGYTLS